MKGEEVYLVRLDKERVVRIKKGKESHGGNCSRSPCWQRCALEHGCGVEKGEELLLRRSVHSVHMDRERRKNGGLGPL
jgi:hypothetical protein